MTSKWVVALSIPVLALGLGAPAIAALGGTAVDGPATIVAVNPKGTVVATDSQGNEFSFVVKDPAILKSMRAGQSVLVSEKARRVSVKGAENCCEIVRSRAQ